MFKELGEFITRHALGIAIFWALLLIVAAPLAATFSDRLSYNVETFIPHDIGAIETSDLYQAQFPGSDNSQILVAVQDGDPGLRASFIDRLNATVRNGSVANITSTTSVYDVQRDALANASYDLFRGLHDLGDNVTTASDGLYNGTDDLLNASKGLYELRGNLTEISSGLGSAWGQAAGASQQLYDARAGIVSANAGMYQMEGIAGVFFGLPNAYAQLWVSNPTGASTPDELKTATHNLVKNQIAAMPAANQPLAYQYIDQFNNSWSIYTPTDLTSATAAADAIVSGSGRLAQSFASGITGVPPDQKQVMIGVAQAFTIPIYNNLNARQDTIVGMTLEAGGLTEADRPRMNAIYGLGASPTGAAIDQLTLSLATAGLSQDAAGQLRALYAERNSPDGIWDYVLDQALAGQNNSTVRELIADAWSLGRTPLNSSFDRLTLDYASKDLNDSEKARLQEIYAWGPGPAPATVRAYVLNQSGADLNQTGRDFLAEVYDLGRSPSRTVVDNYVIGKVNQDLNITGNLSYFHALLGLDGNASRAAVEAFARGWAITHDLSDPAILPSSVIDSMSKGDLSLFVIGLSDSDETQAAQQSVVQVRDMIKSLKQEPAFRGLNAYVTGSAAMGLDSKNSALSDVDNIDKISIVLILLLLGLYFRSVLTPFAPLAIIGVAIAVAFGLLHLLSYQISMYYLILVFTVVIMLGAGTDYCVFLLSRYAEERAKGQEIKASVVKAVEQAGKSVTSSGLTAMIGFGALTLVGNGIFASVGVSVAIGIFVALSVALTLLPAALTLLGDRIFWPRKLYNSGTKGLVSGLFARLTEKVLPNALAIVAIALIITVPAVYYVSQMNLGMDFVAMMSPGQESKLGFDAINSAFGSGTVDRLMVLLVLPGPGNDAAGNITPAALDRAEDVSALLAGMPNVDKVQSMTRPEGATINYDNLSSYPLIQREYYQANMKDSLGKDNRTIVLYVSLNGSPYSIQSGRTIDDIRANLSAYGATLGDGTRLLLGGSPVGTFEFQKMTVDRYDIIYAVVFVGIFLVLMTLLRSVFTPLRLIVTLVMSICWTVAAYVLIFQEHLGYTTIWLLPIFLFCALMGLGVDYDIFLVSRVREEVLNGKTDEDAILHAVEATGTIITLCGAVMASAFGSMLISSSSELQEFGFVLFFAIILDATLIRLVLVPAIMVLMKKYNWWMPFLGTPQAKPRAAEPPRIEEPKK